jgi:hypothetical protein
VFVFVFHLILWFKGSFWAADEKGRGGGFGWGNFLVRHCHTLLVHFLLVQAFGSDGFL